MRVHGDNRQYANGFCCYRAFKLKSFDLKNALTSRNFDISLTSSPCVRPVMPECVQLTNCFRIFSINRRNTIFATENKRSLTKPLFYQPIEGAPILRLPISSVQIEPSALCSMFPDSSLDAVRIESVA